MLGRLVLIPALLAIVSCDLPLDVNEVVFRDDDSLGYRLPEDLDPISYEVEVTPYFEEAPENKTPFTFDGVVTIAVRALKDNLTSLIIQENVRNITGVSLEANSTNTPVTVNATNPFTRIREFHLLRVNLDEGVTLVNGDVYLLTITYIGNINETPLSRGVFRGSYRDKDGKLHWYAATHLQPVNSRQAFPSFDEPGFKSTFNIIVNRPAHFTETFSNMPIKENSTQGDRVREVFYTTPRMSAYLVTFHISEEFKVIAENNNAEEPYRILARPEAEGQGEYALEVGPPITKWLVDYFNISYYGMADGLKNDQIASPDWASGATENWGLVTYRENRLLYEEGETNIVDKINIGTITAHELAHKWFGNLITCRWWDNVWINEGFASYFEYFAMDGADPSLELHDQFIIMYLQSALSADASLGTRALRHTVNSPSQVTGHFSGISYSKGASLLLMLKHFLGEGTFKTALNKFLLDRSYEHAFPEDLYRAFASAVENSEQSTDVDIEAFMQYWVDEPGYPLLTVEFDTENGVLSLTQERFLINPSDDNTDQVWPLPLTFTTGDDPDWSDLTPKHLMTTPTLEIEVEAGEEWVIFNLQQKGIYRVNYNERNWELLAAALDEDHTKIHHLNRAQIVDDVFALMRAEKLSYMLGFRVLAFLKKDTGFYSWYPAISGFNWLRNRLLHIPGTLAQFDDLLHQYLDEVVKDVGYDGQPGEAVTRTLNRFYILSFACNVGYQGCLENSAQKYAAFKDDNVSVDPNLRRHVFCTGLRQGGYDDWSNLRNRRLNSNNHADAFVTLRALGCTSDEKAVEEHLENILTEEVKAQDRVNALNFLYMGVQTNANIVLQFLKTRMDDVRIAVVLPAWFENVITNLVSYLNEEGLEDMEEWVSENQSTFPEHDIAVRSINTARSNMQWGSERAELILAALRGSASTAMLSMTVLAVSLLVVMIR
ncbi:membrane alanyl aminopeptidase-like [Achroia grisella]|uniref:membrane alanyl aminopeptidase-like n=1 Tax=Achroia grisella TaxID=688607 RepID=UPI0027D21E3C|nr:membrane alanyl aminopeptidase-like [Achroia grisella]